MFRFLRWILLLIVLAVAGVLGYAATLSDTFSVTRMAKIKATPEKIYPMIANLKTFNTWNPFVLQDPDLKLAYSGPESGKGATNTWTGSPHAGSGKLSIIDETPPNGIKMMLDMEKPLEAHNTVTFTLKSEADGTLVTWDMSGTRPYVGKVMDVVFNMDHMVGSQFETGLASLKTLAEK